MAINIDELKSFFSYASGTSLSKAIVFAALDINKLMQYLPIEEYRKDSFAALWKETFWTGSNWTAQFRTELNQEPKSGEGRLAHRLFEAKSVEGIRGYCYRLKDSSKLTPSDAQTLKNIKEEFKRIMNSPIDVIEDDRLINSLGEIQDDGSNFSYLGQKKTKIQTVSSNGREYYPRNKETAVNALRHAKFKCENDSSHLLFVRRKDGRTPYTEPHHLVPLSAYRDFDVSLDVEENIISLCSHCHNLIHYGVGAKETIKKLYELRKEDLKKVGIDISLDKLLEYYNL